MDEPIKVNIGACRCPDKPHEEDWVGLAAHASFDLGTAASLALKYASMYSEGKPRAEREAAIELAVGRVYVQHGVVAWNLTDELHMPLKVDPDSVLDQLPWGQGGREVAEKAGSLYYEEVMAPLVARALASSPASLIGTSTSANGRTAPSHPKRSRRSSIATSVASSQYRK